MLILALGLTFWNKSLFHLVKNTWEKCNFVIEWLKIFCLRLWGIWQGWFICFVKQVSLLKLRDTFSFGISNTLNCLTVKEEILNSISWNGWLSSWNTLGAISNLQESKLNFLIWEFFNNCCLRCLKAVFWTNSLTFCKEKYNLWDYFRCLV